MSGQSASFEPDDPGHRSPVSIFHQNFSGRLLADACGNRRGPDLHHNRAGEGSSTAGSSKWHERTHTLKCITYASHCARPTSVDTNALHDLAPTPVCAESEQADTKHPIEQGI